MSRVSIYAFAIAAALLLLSSAKAQHWTYGKGCAGLNFVWKGTARLGTILTAKLTTTTPGAPGLVVIGWPWPCRVVPQHLTRQPGCLSCIFPLPGATVPILTNVWGIYHHDIGIPNDRALVGLSVAVQFWVGYPPVAGDRNWASSNAGWFRVRS